MKSSGGTTSYFSNIDMNLETENVTIDFSSTDNFCPDTTSSRIEVVSGTGKVIDV